jgi:hypothetical protein
VLLSVCGWGSMVQVRHWEIACCSPQEFKATFKEPHLSDERLQVGRIVVWCTAMAARLPAVCLYGCACLMHDLGLWLPVP